MVILTLAGLWALAFGRITITSSLSLEGRRARYYGLALLVAALVYGLLGGIVASVIASLVPTLAERVFGASKPDLGKTRQLHQSAVHGDRSSAVREPANAVGR